MKPDEATRALAGKAIWGVAQWLEAHCGGEPYEIFDGDGGYRLTVERIPHPDKGPDERRYVQWRDRQMDDGIWHFWRLENGKCVRLGSSLRRERVRRARKVHHGCHPIQPGDLYVEHTEFPGGDSGYADSAGHPVRLAECRACAERYGRGHLIDAYPSR